MVVTCNEALREVTLFQNTAGKSSSKTYRFDKVDTEMLQLQRQGSQRELWEASTPSPLFTPTVFSLRALQVFGCDSTQEKLFKQAVVPIVHEVMDGFNCTIFAYGQTGTGKTYTMEGGPRESDDGRKLSAQAGVIPRSIKQIFDHIEASNTDSTVKVRWGTHPRSLSASAAHSSRPRGLRVSPGEHIIKGVSVLACRCPSWSSTTRS